MRRVLKFRAWVEARTFNGEPKGFEYLDLYVDNENDFANFPPKNIEQYTGLKDKNGKEIYEGDIVGIYQEYCDLEGDKTWEELEPWGQVVYEDNKARFGIWGDSPYEGEDKHFFDLVEGLEVIGNIHENKELLGGEE